MKAGDYTGWVLMAGALIVGGLAYYMVRQYISAEETRLRTAVESERGRTQRVVVAAQPLPAGALIGSQTMAVGEIPQRHTPSRAVVPAAFKSVDGRVLTRPMSAGEPLLEDFVSGTVIERFSDLLEAGHRAVSLEVTTLQAHSGMLLPGDFVDLFAIVDEGGDVKRKRMVPLLERVKVIAAGPEPLRAREQQFQPLPERAVRYSMISIGVSAEDAERITLAAVQGEIAYLLRNAQDTRLLASEAGRAFFGAPDALPGYVYYSNAAPAGERRTPPIAEHAVGEVAR